MQTTVPYVATTSQLIGLPDHVKPYITPGSMSVQYLDDALDINKDFAANTSNLFVGLATSLGQQWALEDALRVDPTRKNVQRSLPLTRRLYRKAYQQQVDQIGLPLYNRLLTLQGRRLL